ncbi:endonuclease/exonuclease/phosphatase family protein [bacterium]|nr:endonuclease/exonuclease/phosphatase family protein [bacterium]
MNPKNISLLTKAACFVAILSVFTARAADDAPSPVKNANELRVLSYNVQFLPGIAQLFNARGNDDYRPRKLGEVLKEFDVIGLNEVFELKPRGIILVEIKKAWGDQFYVFECPEPAKEVGRFNAGLAIVSRYPIVESHHIAYSAWSTKKEFGVFADEFAAKGALHARIRIRDGKDPIDIDFFTTHMDSKLASARKVQGEELAAFAAKYSSPDNTAIFTGDFNTRGNLDERKRKTDEYFGLVERLKSFRGSLQDLWLVVGKGDGGTSDQDPNDGGSRIDYIFFAPPVKGVDRLKPLRANVLHFLDPRVKALSDHSAVEGVFQITAH